MTYNKSFKSFEVNGFVHQAIHAQWANIYYQKGSHEMTLIRCMLQLDDRKTPMPRFYKGHDDDDDDDDF